MAKVQKEFERFHEVIRTDFDFDTKVREKRDRVLKVLRENLEKEERPGFEVLLQGSYKMKTGVQPIGELEHDIDVGLRFDIGSTTYKAAVVRKWVLDAVTGHTGSTEDKPSCIRVAYAGDFHVDLVCYANRDEFSSTEPLKRGTRDADWKDASPQALLDYVDGLRKAFADTEDSKTKTDQFRRVVRCLRRWDDVAIPKESKTKPTGLAFVLLVGQTLHSPVTFVDGSPDDRRALEILTTAWSTAAGRLKAAKPTPEYEDVLSQLTEEQMTALKQRFAKLAAVLGEADSEIDPVKACTKLREQFGKDFPIPDPDETGRKSRGPAIVPSSSAAIGS